MYLRTRLALAATALILSACGGGDEPVQPAPFIYDKLVVFGDSLSDVGTHRVGTIQALSAGTGGAGRWTVNSVIGGEMWVEKLAIGIGVMQPCAAETGLSPNLPVVPPNPPVVGAAITAQQGCFGYAQGSARVTSPVGPNSIALQQAPFNQQTLGLIAKPVLNQMAAHLAAVGGSYSGSELVTVLAGANDLFMELAFLGQPGGPADGPAAVANMSAAGDTLGQLIRNQVLAKGAKRVLVLNMPYVSGTPYARALDVTTPGTNALIDAMTNAFNAALAGQLAGVSNVRLGDAYAASKDQFTNPAKYGILNVDDVACGANALGTTSLVCNASNQAVVDVSRYLYADDVHPTPYGHQLLANFASDQLVAAGWK